MFRDKVVTFPTGENMKDEILTEMRDGALIITFNRPEHGNAMTLDMASQLYAVVKPAAQDPAVRVVVLRGAGNDFMNGIDIGIYNKDVSSGIQKKSEVLLPYHSAIRELHAMNKPVIAKVKGRCVRAGLSFVLVADLVIAARSARFRANYTSLGMTPDGGVSIFLTRKVGTAKATEILILNEEFGAEAAEKMALVNAVVDEDDLVDKSNQWVDLLSHGPTQAYGAVKKLIDNAAGEKDLYNHIGIEHTYWGVISRTFDFRNAINAHFANKPPEFKGT